MDSDDEGTASSDWGRGRERDSGEIGETGMEPDGKTGASMEGGVGTLKRFEQGGEADITTDEKAATETAETEALLKA